MSSMTPSVPCCATVGSSHAHPCGNSPRDSIRDLIVSVSTRPGMVNCRSPLRAVVTLDSTALQPALRLCPSAERMLAFEWPVLELITNAAAVKRSRCDHALVPKLFPFGCVSCIKAAHTLSTWTLLAMALCSASDPASIVGPPRSWATSVSTLVMLARSANTLRVVCVRQAGPANRRPASRLSPRARRVPREGVYSTHLLWATHTAEERRRRGAFHPRGT